MNIEQIVNKQKKYYLSQSTKTYNFRKQALLALKASILKNKDSLITAFQKDFNKCEFDVITTELSIVTDEINFALKHLKQYMKPKKVKTNIINFPSKGYIYAEPYGNVLILSPWNYPFQLTILPLIGSIAAGNVSIVKPSELSPNVSEAIKKILSVFNEEYIATILGDKEICQNLLEQKFDYIFYTGGDHVGRIVMEKAAKNLTPITLELGGKSPCIVLEDADLDIAAKRIVWGKYLNAGQTCVAPDYLLVNRKIHKQLIVKLLDYIKKFYYTDGKINSTFTHIINTRHEERLNNLLIDDKVIIGGKSSNLLMEPTIMDNVSFDDNVMQEEIFGPILPIITFDTNQEIIDLLNSKDKPLAFYLFSKSKKEIKEFINSCSFGGGCINDTIMHLTNASMPFGGIGKSGMGSYHGKKSFECFSHYKSVLKKGKQEINLKYPPYSDKHLHFVNKMVK